MRKLLSLFFLLLLACGYAKTQNRVIVPPRIPQINVKNLYKDEKPVVISEVKTDVKVVGSLAITTVEMLVSNPNNRILEGELEFPLSEGQSISRLALDINGKLREGVAVDKAKGQAAFESVVRRGVDPALLEKTVGNNFKLRVYPLPAKGTRKVVIAYEQELSKKDGSYRFILPIEYGNVLKKFDLHLTVFGSQETPKVDETPWGSFSFDRQGDGYMANYSKTDFDAKGQLVFSVPIKNESNTYIEKGKIGNEYIFYSKIFPDVAEKTKTLPKTIDLYWDASSSMSKRNISLELDLLGKYLSTIKDVTVNLNTFNVILSKSQKFEIKNGDWSRLRAALENQKYDGATQYGIIDLKKASADEVLLFSDGISNFGKSDIAIGKQPIVVVNSSMINDDSNLKYLALSTGGKYISLLNQTPDEALTMLKSENYRLISIDYNQNQITDITTSGLVIKPESGFFVTGKLLTIKATITLKFGVGNDVLDTQKIEMNASQASDYDNIIERVWAAKRIEELDLRYERNKEEIAELGKKYNIVTRNTSLIVLENLSDYLQYDITPPEELRTEYERLKKEQWQRKEDLKQNKTDRILSLLDTRKEWWNTVFEYKPIETKKSKKEIVNAPGNTRGVVVDSSGEPIIGAAVTIKNTNRGTITDIDGKFGVNASVGDVLIFSYLGFNTKEVPVSSISVGKVKLEENQDVLEEVVVTALGASRADRNEVAYDMVEDGDVPPPPPMRETVQFTPPVTREVAEEIEASISMSDAMVVSVVSSEDMDFSETNNLNAEINKLAGSGLSSDISEILRTQPSVASSLAGKVAGVATETTNPTSRSKNAITLKTWTPDAPYMKTLQDSSDKELYTTYLSLKDEYATTPSFFLDVATIMENRGMKEDAFLVLSNVAELDLQNYRLMRVLAYRLLQLGYTDYAINLFEKVLVLRPEEPQSYRDLALANEQAKNYQKTIDLYNEALYKNWDGRFREIEIILLEEMNHAITKAKENNVRVNLSDVDSRLIFDMPVDVRVVFSWDTDNSDMDLWVTDPTGEKCYYSNNRTKIGGLISADFTDGYGPEEFLIKKAISGTYKVQTNYYGSREQTLIGPTTIYLDIFTNYGKRNEKKQTVMLRLTENKETIDIGQVEW